MSTRVTLPRAVFARVTFPQAVSARVTLQRAVTSQHTLYCVAFVLKLEAEVHRIPRAPAHTFVKKNPEFDLAIFAKISLGGVAGDIFRSHF